MAKDRGGRNRAGRGRPDPRVEPVPASSPVEIASRRGPALSLDERLRESVSAGALKATPVAGPTDAPVPVPAAPAPRHGAQRELATPTIPPEPARAAADRPAVEALGATLITHVCDESIATLSHLRALGAARSPAEAIRLQVVEMQRAADATLTCWSQLARGATRLMTSR